MSVGGKPEIFHSDDMTSEFLEESLPGQPVDHHIQFIDADHNGLFNQNYQNDSMPVPEYSSSSTQNHIYDNQPPSQEYIVNRNIAPTSGLELPATKSGRQDPHLFTRWQKIRYGLREPFAEFLGTMVMIMFGNGVVAQKILSKEAAGNYTTIALSWATAVFLGYSLSAGISGAHLNPGVTLSAAVFRKFPWRKVPFYIFGQFLGGYVGALMVYAVYVQSINEFEGGIGIRTVTGDKATAGLFCTFSQSFLSTRGQVASELVSSALLQLGIFAMTDPYNSPLGNAFPFGLFFLIYGIGSSFGYQTGYAINLARDFGPRLAAASVGYGSELFSYGHYYFWVPLIIPIIGCLLGAFIYDVLIYQGHDSPINQKDLGWGEHSAKMKEFKLKDMRPDFDIERAKIGAEMA